MHVTLLVTFYYGPTENSPAYLLMDQRANIARYRGTIAAKKWLGNVSKTNDFNSAKSMLIFVCRICDSQRLCGGS